MTTFTQRVSLHGRRLGLSSSGGLVAISSAGSTAGANVAAQMWGSGAIETVSANAATIRNSGVTIVSTDSTSGATFDVSAPVAGVHKEIHFQTSATALTLNTTATTIKFNSTLAEAAAGGSTLLNIVGAAAGTAGSLILRGLSATAWSIASKTVAAST